MAQIKIPQATRNQQTFMESLSSDLSFSRDQRNKHISNQVGREIKYLDELTLGEASNVIEIFKRWKENGSISKIEEGEWDE